MVHIVWKFPEAEIGGSQSDTVSLLQQEMAKCAFDIQQIKVNLNKLSSLKTKEQLNKYNKHAEQLVKERFFVIFWHCQNFVWGLECIRRSIHRSEILNNQISFSDQIIEYKLVLVHHQKINIFML